MYYYNIRYNVYYRLQLKESGLLFLKGQTTQTLPFTDEAEYIFLIKIYNLCYMSLYNDSSILILIKTVV